MFPFLDKPEHDLEDLDNRELAQWAGSNLVSASIIAGLVTGLIALSPVTLVNLIALIVGGATALPRFFMGSSVLAEIGVKGLIKTVFSKKNKQRNCLKNQNKDQVIQVEKQLEKETKLEQKQQREYTPPKIQKRVMKTKKSSLSR